MINEMRHFGSLLVIVTVCAIGVAYADQWTFPRMLSIRSDSGNFLVTITPAPYSPNNPIPCIARMFLCRENGDDSLIWRRPLINSIRPLEALLTNKGQLVTFDNWGGAGTDNAVTVYDKNGLLLRTHHFDSLIPASLVPGMSASVSSIWWWASAFVEAESDTLCVLVKSNERLPDSISNTHSLRREYALREIRVCLSDGSIVTPIDPTPAGIKSWQEIPGP